MASISAVICAYTEERWDDMCAAVDSLRRQTLPPSEILLVVDHNPALLARVRASLPGVVAIANRQERGLSGGKNSGIAAARGELIAFLDDDAVAAPDWLERLAAGYTHPEVLGVGGATDPAWTGERPSWFPEEFFWVVGCTYRGTPLAAEPVRNLFGGNASFRRSVFESVGGFRCDMGRVGKRPVGCEETEFCIRLRQRWPQGILRYEPGARIYHRVPASRGSWHYYHSRCYGEGLSKAMVARLVGSSDALATERGYTLRTLPQGIARGLGDAVRRSDAMGLARAASIVTGLAATTAGYLVGAVSGRRAPQMSSKAANANL